MLSSAMYLHFNSRPSARGDVAQDNIIGVICISIHAPPRGATSRLQRLIVLTAAYFNSRPSARGDLLEVGKAAANAFQFTPLREGRHSHAARLWQQNDFNSRPSARGDTGAFGTLGGILSISIHAPPRGATKCRMSCKPPSTHFNSRPSARGDGRRPSSSDARFISIHAPPRGATQPTPTPTPPASYFNSRPSARGDKSVDAQKQAFAISIHAPPRGATCCRFCTPSIPRNFNSRPSARGDVRRAKRPGARNISIHAPPRGATFAAAVAALDNLFQFTPLREGRRREQAGTYRPCYFNSRPSARGDLKAVLKDATGQISIHAPPRGATITTPNSLDSGVFQFTPLREGRRSRPRPGNQIDKISIHAPPRGATP